MKIDKNTPFDGIESVEIAFSLIEFSYRIAGCFGPTRLQELFQSELEIKGTLIEGKI